MLDAVSEVITDGRVHKYELREDGRVLTYAEVVQRLQVDADLRSLLIAQLADSPFSAFRWETPPITSGTIDRPFEFVLLNSPTLARASDPKTYARYFSRDDAHEGIVTFENLGKDALLVVPSPRAGSEVYGHLAAFIRGAPEHQIHAFWKTVGKAVEGRLGDPPLWVSTAGGGVAWLHLRLDSSPKYYGHAPYRPWP